MKLPIPDPYFVDEQNIPFSKMLERVQSSTRETEIPMQEKFEACANQDGAWMHKTLMEYRDKCLSLWQSSGAVNGSQEAGEVFFLSMEENAE